MPVGAEDELPGRGAVIAHRRAALVVAMTTAGLVLAMVHGGPRAQPATRMVIAPGAEEPDAAARGKDDVAAAQRLARSKRFAEAVVLLERVASTLPSAVHDCNLSLAYLRAGQLTRAQLMWDVSRLRGTAPPGWCTGSLASELSGELRQRGFVPVRLDVTPAGAEVEVGGVLLRDLSMVWLPPGTHTVAARAPDMVEQFRTVVVTAPSTQVSITLVAPPPELPPETIDAGVAPEPDAAVVEPVAIDAGVIAPPPPPPAAPRWPAYAAAGAGVAGLAVGMVFHTSALSTKDRANQLARDTQEFATARDDFGRQRAIAVGGYVVGAIGVGVAAWWWFGRSQRADDRPPVGVVLGGDRATVVVEGRW